MLVPSTSESGNLFGVLEGGLAAISFALAFAWPGMLSKTFGKIERVFSRLARQAGAGCSFRRHCDLSDSHRDSPCLPGSFAISS